MAEGTWRTQGPAGPPGVTRQASDRRVEPPLVVQNAMLTKDKKPFTYTPGGIDLSEIKSPRMARRIERNAMAPGVGDVPRTSPPRGPTGPLPPSALAAMQPALPVQVFPSGGPPAPPPPPPPSANIPPPPPMQPLPTKAVATNEGIFERPDMTKIIPENPMALLRKTGGVNRRSIVEDPDYAEVRPQIINEQNYASPQISMPGLQNRTPVQPSHQIPPPVQSQNQTQYVQSKPQMAATLKQECDEPSEIKTSTAQLGSLYIPPLNNSNQQERNVAATPSVKATPPPTPPQRNPQSPAQSPGSPQSPMATLNKAPRPWQTPKTPSTEVPPWAHRSQSPSLEEQQSPVVQQPTTPVYNQTQLPHSPNIQQNAVNQQKQQQWQQQQQQQQWQQQQQQQQQWQQQQQQQKWQQQQHQQNITQQQRIPPQSPNIQSNVVGRVIIPVQMDFPPASQNQNVEAVYVTQPIVLQHPGPRGDVPQQNQQKTQQQQFQQQQRQQQQEQQQQQILQQQRQQQYQQQQKVVQNSQQSQKTESKSIRIIPIQIEGANNVQRQESNYSNSTTPATGTPGTARSFNRQPSWSQTGPTQSNSFKVIQKITNTDGEDDENEESTKHSPRNSQHFQQTPADQIRKLKLNEDDQEFMNKLKQGVDGDIFLHREVDPRYRGATIPSKAFKYLQSMTDSSNLHVTPSVPKSAQAGNHGPAVRSIPVQIEGEGNGKAYIPPSEQTVQEPKKYTGGKIPSRSFKVLQAMTGEAYGPDQSDL